VDLFVYGRSRGVGEDLNDRRAEGDPQGAADKAKDKAQVAKGHAKEAAGRATGDPLLEAQGKGDKVVGNLRQAGEKRKDAVKK